MTCFFSLGDRIKILQSPQHPKNKLAESFIVCKGILLLFQEKLGYTW